MTVAVRSDYEELLKTLSEASVERHFDAFADISWDDPRFEIIPDDPRWVLPAADLLGATDWYRGLPLHRQIEIGMYRQASIVKVGLQFEQILIGGIMNFAMRLPNGSPEFRYATHEATEECHHTQMFQELVNRIGAPVRGGPRWFRRLGPLMSYAAGVVPFGFFVGVLAGEEPIDYMQKTILRSESELHPLLSRIMQIHIAEEARHIGFAHEYLQHTVTNLTARQRFLVALATPVVMRVLCDVIMKPGKQMCRDLQIPQSVVDEAWWDSPDSQRMLRDIFGDARMLVEELDLMTPAAARMWRAMKIDGRPSRFRNEPRRAAG
ncbi:AurF N-oxygenase family protein [Williamsia sterculiae]|uniref:p-aminobenzoate N-oxygenase AurF n=1 Tax=Williamsia sterculiae TaxID=1344003 RepID=A0A1N7FHF2_9NOCA|nr:diiron oxygenase [Williamsia sterculiae]SIR99858.1 P-aminobenzoate N-oxygenase AurF [Williamsia sterculiae]